MKIGEIKVRNFCVIKKNNPLGFEHYNPQNGCNNTEHIFLSMWTYYMAVSLLFYFDHLMKYRLIEFEKFGAKRIKLHLSKKKKKRKRRLFEFACFGINNKQINRMIFNTFLAINHSIPWITCWNISKRNWKDFLPSLFPVSLIVPY